MTNTVHESIKILWKENKRIPKQNMFFQPLLFCMFNICNKKMLLQKLELFQNICHKIYKTIRYGCIYRNSTNNKPVENLLQPLTDQKGKFNKKNFKQFVVQRFSLLMMIKHVRQYFVEHQMQIPLSVEIWILIRHVVKSKLFCYI